MSNNLTARDDPLFGGESSITGLLCLALILHTPKLLSSPRSQPTLGWRRCTCPAGISAKRAQMPLEADRDSNALFALSLCMVKYPINLPSLHLVNLNVCALHVRSSRGHIAPHPSLRCGTIRPSLARTNQSNIHITMNFRGSANYPRKPSQSNELSCSSCSQHRQVANGVNTLTDVDESKSRWVQQE